ncbi:MAG TPA: Ig-like domain-containing protein [Candidatus Sulfotelmatobacter sp.]|nr:Ig-like domain-containing protein [Candidatus Sulfotelmatobacter sp.]
MWIDVGQLIREQVPDKNGNTLPAALAMGSYELQELPRHAGGGDLYEGKIVYDKKYGNVTYGCMGCCGIKETKFYFDPLGIPLNSAVPQDVQALDTCSGSWIDITSDFDNTWSTANQAVATVDTWGTHTGVAIGSTTTSAYAQEQMFGHTVCPIENVYPGGNDNVTPSVSFSNISGVAVGQTATTTATVRPSNNTTAISLSISGGAVIVSPTGTFTTTTSIVVKGLTAGTATLTATITNPDGGGTETIGSTSFNIVNAIPVNFGIQAESNLPDGSLFFTYTWSSSTGNQSDLAQCTVGESVFYPNYPATPYVWPLPMTQSTINPTVRSASGNNAVSNDQNYPPGSYQEPYSTANFQATQRLWWTCPYYHGGSQQQFVPDITITRTVFKDMDGLWKYQIGKSGYTNTVRLPNQ